jgi:hypothetical protein
MARHALVGDTPGSQLVVTRPCGSDAKGGSQTITEG